MKKGVITLGLTLLIIASTYGVSNAKVVIDTGKTNSGIVSVMSTNANEKKTKVRIIKGSKMVTYDLHKFDESVPYALTFGNGSYDLKVYEQIQGTQYQEVASKSFNVKIENDNNVYLNSTQEVNWNNSQRYIKEAKRITKNAKSNEEKVRIIYDYLTSSFTYDYTKINKIDTSYKPDLEVLYDEQTGICYDYSAIFAGMLRSVGVPTKLVKGYSKQDTNTFHAWNAVYVDNTWKMIDTTNDAYKIQNGKQVSMFKADSDFIVSNEY